MPKFFIDWVNTLTDSQISELIEAIPDDMKDDTKFVSKRLLTLARKK
jgi:hypothetical protein